MRVRNNNRILNSTTTSFKIIDVLTELNGARVTEVANSLDISKSSACNHLHTLQNSGYVVMQGDEYHPGLKFAFTGEHAKMYDYAYQDAIEVTKELDEKVPFETGFIVEENGIGRFLKPEVPQSSEFDEFALTGEEVHLHTVAAGKAILASFSEDHIDKIINHWGLPEKTEQTITSRERLIEELTQAREQGYAVNRGENREGIRGVAKIANKPNGTVVGAMSITSPAYRAKKESFNEHAVNLLKTHVHELEQRLLTAVHPTS